MGGGGEHITNYYVFKLYTIAFTCLNEGQREKKGHGHEGKGERKGKRGAREGQQGCLKSLNVVRADL